MKLIWVEAMLIFSAILIAERVTCASVDVKGESSIETVPSTTTDTTVSTTVSTPTPTTATATTPTAATATTPTPATATTPNPVTATTPTTATESSSQISTTQEKTSTITLSTPQGTQGTTALKIEYVNDLRYNFFSLDEKSAAVCSSSVETNKCFGGVGCLWQLSSKTDVSTLRLHAGNALGMGSDGDKYLALKLDTASDLLANLKLSAMSFDIDMLRFGARQAKRFVEKMGAVTTVVSSNYFEDSKLFELKAYTLVSLSEQTCQVAVIGMTNPETSATYTPSSSVLDPIAYINSTVEKIKAENKETKMLYVVIGEASISLSKDILNSVDDITVVIHSGYNQLNESSFDVLTTNSRTKVRASLPPAKDKLSMLLGQLTLPLDQNCLLSGTPEHKAIKYGDTPVENCDDDGAKTLKAKLSTAQQELASLQTVVGRSALTLSGALDTCGVMSCSLGQLVADSARASAMTVLLKENATWTTNSRGVLLPAWALKASDAAIANGAKLSGQSLMAAVVDDPFLCQATFTGKQLHSLLEAMLSQYSSSSPTSSFPHVSGISMEVDITAAVGERIVGLYAETPSLYMLPVDSLDENVATGVSMVFPCVLLERDPLVLELKKKGIFDSLSVTELSLTLSKGLGWGLTGAEDILVPPVAQDRVLLRNGWPSTSELCEDWTGPTVFYTVLVLAAVAMIAYQGYQYWRFRSVLSYVR